MQRDGQLDHTEPGAEMAAAAGDGFDQVLAQFARDVGQFGFVELFASRRASRCWRGADSAWGRSSAVYYGQSGIFRHCRHSSKPLQAFAVAARGVYADGTRSDGNTI